MKAWMWLVCLVVVAAAVWGAVFTRYEVNVEHRGGFAVITRWDRWTGEVSLSVGGLPWVQLRSPKDTPTVGRPWDDETVRRATQSLLADIYD
jgi:hypothetical protein